MKALMQKFWEFREENKTRPLYGLVSLGGEQPKGYIIGWSVSKADCERERQKKATPENWIVEKFTYQANAA